MGHPAVSTGRTAQYLYRTGDSGKRPAGHSGKHPAPGFAGRTSSFLCPDGSPDWRKTEVHDNKLSLKVTRLTREIEQTLNQRQVEPGKALSLILECAAEKYRVCQMGRLDHRTGNIQDQLKGHSEDREMDRQLFSQIIEKVILEPKGSVKLQLINEKII